MVKIIFIGPYKPIMCGIADYTSFVIDKCPTDTWGMLSFNLKKYGVPLISDLETNQEYLWYGIPDRDSYNELDIMEGLAELGINKNNSLLWFQHEFGIWHENSRFINMLKEIKIPKIVTLHSLHFQSSETPYGLRREQYDFLFKLLPHVNAITVFNQGVHKAVSEALPKYRQSVYTLKHGIHSYPDIRRLSRPEAKALLNDYILYESDTDLKTKELLHRQKIFIDPGITVIGQSGFLSPAKGSELLFMVRNNMQKMMPYKKIAAVRIGAARDDTQKSYANQLKEQTNENRNFLMETWLPESMLPVAQRAFDINFYWPLDCTQSGILAHALGAGAIIAGRELEGVGETLKDAYQTVSDDLKKLQIKMIKLILNPIFCEMIEERTLDYAREYCWENQAQRHFEIAENILNRVKSFTDIPKALMVKPSLS
jgi:hypothetical protein